MVWYDVVDLALPRDVDLAKEALVLRCRKFFGLQFGRYSGITVSLMRGAETVVDIPVDPDLVERDLDADSEDLAAA